MMNEHANPGQKIVAQMRAMTDEQRLEIMDHFCKECGANNPRCQCCDDD